MRPLRLLLLHLPLLPGSRIRSVGGSRVGVGWEGAPSDCGGGEGQGQGQAKGQGAQAASEQVWA